MRISVRSRCAESGQEPSSFCLGRSQLQVVSILERRELADAHCFEVRVLDGRSFVMCHQPQTDSWELAAVYGRRARREMPAASALPAGRTSPLCRKALAAIAHAWNSSLQIFHERARLVSASRINMEPR